MKRLIRTLNKHAQSTMGLPFGLIFSIILIVVFIVIAFIAVKYFLGIGNCSEVGLFYDELQDKVNEAWSSQQSSFSFKIELPSSIDRLCFSNLTSEITNIEDYEKIKNYDVYEANLFLLPPEEACNMPYKLIKNINISEITRQSNPYCTDSSGSLKIKKDFYGKLVVIE